MRENSETRNLDAFGASELLDLAADALPQRYSLVAEAGALHCREQANFDIRLGLFLCSPLTPTTYTHSLTSQHTPAS
jgi:hypothetical protein